MSRCRCTALLALILALLVPLALAWYLANPFQVALGHAPTPETSAFPEHAALDVPAEAQAKFYAGHSSCSGRSCHGGLEANPAPAVGQNEYSRWTSLDKHSQAFAVLDSPRGERIARNLAAANRGGVFIPASRDVRCLACHVTPQLAEVVASSQGTHPLAEEGVGCEACHGPASAPKEWLNEHTRASWKDRKKANAQALYDDYHMNNLGDLRVQAATCAGCHVGAPEGPDHNPPARDLNHDLMAAGHPRLTFELTSFRENMPPHWQNRHHADPAAAQVYEARSWAVGQVVAARSSLDLLRYRARRSPDEKNPAGFQNEQDTSPWPEFAEADCFSCHAGFRVPSWRKEDYRRNRPLGAIPYCTWYSFMLPSLTPGDPLGVLKDYQSIRTLMNTPRPPREEIIKLCNKLLGEGAAAKDAPMSKLAALVDDPKHFNAETTSKILSWIRTEGEKDRKALNWDEIEQLTLAVSALSSSNEQTRRALEALWKTDLAYPPGRESPTAFRRDDFNKRWTELLETLPK
jgi:hypothetical protein